ncbi:MAG TPA: BamA/TamA family outer membrane protein [Terriglobales bacterium]|nr:BamA/TamA family outer membrane protein [Terriglobales bacterium]
MLGTYSSEANQIGTARRNLRVLYIAVAVAALFASTGLAAAQTSSPQSYPTKRIVDPKTVRRQAPAPVRFVLKPFSIAGSKVEAGLNIVEDSKIHNRLQIMLADPHVRPIVGNLGDGSGFGLGVAFNTAGTDERKLALEGDAHATVKQYVEANLSARLLSRDTPIGALTFRTGVGYKMRPEEDFYGVGPASDFRTNYNLIERSTSATVEVKRGKRVRFGTQLKFSDTVIVNGRDLNFPSTRQAYAPTELAGLGGAQLFETSAFVEYDTRAGRTSPVKGLYVKALASSVEGIDGDFGYWQYKIDQRAYVPLASPRRVFAIRTLLVFSDPRGASQVPFFRLARLGNSETLRGFDPNRFYGRNAAAWNAEYRTDLTGGLGAFAFTDFGQVFNRRADFNTSNFQVTYGAGLQVKTARAILLRTYVARSSEGTRLMISFGPTF